MFSMRFLPALLATVLLSACARPADTRSETPANVGETLGGRWSVRYETEPAPIPLNEPFRMRIEVKPADGSPFPADGTVAVDAVMPTHSHGMNVVPRTFAEGDGRFRVEGMQLHMAGDWELLLDVRAGETVQRATFPLRLEP